MAKYALTIGINNYPGTENDLAGCVNDAKDWASELKKRDFKVTELIDQQATKQRMVEEMKSVIGKAAKGELVVITYSGHGTWQPDDDGDEADMRDEALCPYDLSKGPLLDDDLFEVFTAAAYGARVIMISDSCHSGTVAKFAPAMTNRKIRFMPLAAYEKDERKLSRARAIEKAPPRGRSRASALLLAGCKDTEYSYDTEFNGRPNGAFTRVALEALKGLGAAATYKDWHAAIRKRLPSMDYPQTPLLTATRTQKKWRVLQEAG
jgi:hypothetical protein